MSTDKSDFTGLWLHEGEKRGQPFSHSAADYDHAEAEGGPSTRLRHAYVDQEGGKVGVWVPEHWSEEQVTEALESNW
jgi:hypothetical protein